MEEFNIEKEYDEKRALESVTIELINQCNLSCKHCYLTKDKRHLDKKKVYELIDDARRLGAFSIRLSGGEAMLHPDLEEIITYARRKYMRVSILSNMSVMSERIYECIKRYGVESIEVTIFSLKDLVHDSFVGREGALQQTLKNIERIRKLGIDVLVKTWAIKSNFNELEHMREYFTGKGYMFSVGVQIYSDVNGYMKLPMEERLSEAEYCRALQMEDENRILPIAKDQNDRLCEDFSTGIYVTSEGDFVPCAKFRYPLANVNEKSLWEVWKESEEWHEIQGFCWKDSKECIGCDSKSYCVRCGAMAYIKGKQYLSNCKETCLLAKIRASNYQKVPQGGMY